MADVKIASIEKLSDYEDEYVYDIIMEDESTPFFFANGVLVHNSCYFKTYANNIDEAIIVANEIAKQTNETFPAFMSKYFNCSGGRENLIVAAREIVGERGLFLNVKKKYTIKVVDLDGARVDKLKSMGSEIKKADTPKVVQDFLKGLMNLVLSGKGYDVLEEYVNKNRSGLIHKTEDLIALGASKQINNLDALYAEWTRVEKSGRGKAKLPGHVRAAVNYNELVQQYEPENAKLIRSGDKGVVFYLRPNSHGMTSIAFPADTMHLPSWFTENFSVDMAKTEEKMIDAKIGGIFEALCLEVPTMQFSHIKKSFSF